MIGKFHAIDSFLISPNNQYGIIGDLIEGEVKEGNFVHIKLNSMLALSAKISEIREIEFSGNFEKHTLIVINEDEEGLNDFLQIMNVGCEIVEIHETGEE